MCLGIKVEVHDLSTSQVPQRSLIPPGRSHLTYSFLSPKSHNENLRDPLRSPGPGPSLQRWCAPNFSLIQVQRLICFPLAALKRYPHTDDPATVPSPGI